MAANPDVFFTAIALEDDTLIIADEADFDDLEEAIAFAKSHNWDEVINSRTKKILWSR